MERITQYEAEIKTLKDNISLSGLTHGENEEKLKERVSELEDKCRSELAFKNIQFSINRSEYFSRNFECLLVELSYRFCKNKRQNQTP